MLTGVLPFSASEPLEWVHCHIARQPAPLEERRKDVPPALSAVVLKLLAKTPEERYQTAAGLEAPQEMPAGVGIARAYRAVRDRKKPSIALRPWYRPGTPTLSR
jgi:serine/threonine protein kinase